jgi:SAM-dependent methyltransferase
MKSLAQNLRLIFTRKITDQMGEVESRLNDRASDYERAVDARFDERNAALDARIEERLADTGQRIGERLDERFDERARALELRLDERFVKLEHHTDERFEAVEQRLDSRMEAHEQRTDKYLLQSRTEIVDRTDVMLQIFEQRLDEQRREIRALREALANQNGAAKSDDSNHGSSNVAVTADVPPPNAEQSPAEQILSFRKMAESAGWPTKPRLQSNSAGDSSLYQRILDWKKVAHDGLNNFSADEMEIADYILSFVGDAAEREYVRQHLRRFVGTIERIPPAQSSADRLLELGSLLHLTPAIKKFCGYQEICCADFWESDKQMVYETVMQKDGPEVHTFELHNFNVERDPFPFPDNHFRVALCCELLEHLQSDPMHMLWECNRVLAADGFLLLTTPNIASCRSIEGVLVGCAPYLLSQYNLKTPVDQHNREYAPYEVGLALAAAGFTIVELETEDVWMRSNPAIIELLREVNLPTENRGDNIFALARKTSAPIERHPKELYID